MVLAVVTRIGVVVVDLAVSTYTIFDRNVTVIIQHNRLHIVYIV